MAKKELGKGPSDRIWRFFSSVKLTVVVLLVLAVTSIFGTLIPQNASEAFYMQKYGEVFFRLFSALNIDDMYHAWWFILLLGLLSVNIIVCSIDRLSTTWKIIFPKKVLFSLERFRKLKTKKKFQSKQSLEAMEGRCKSLLSKSVGKVTRMETETGVALFAETGRWTRLGVYVVHLSILLLLVGAVIGSVWGFKGFVNIPEGETRDVLSKAHDPSDHGPEGHKAGEEGTLFSVRCNSFDVSFYDTGAPEEFKSNITIIEKGKEVLTTDIIVNDPLRYKGISLYQSSYGTASAKAALLTVTSRESGMVYQKSLNMGGVLDLPENGGQFTLDDFTAGFNFRGHNIGESFVGKRIDPDGKEVQVVIPVKFPTFDKMRGGSFIFEVASFEKSYYTGLQVTKDPGVWYVYTGFIFMIIGCWITFFMSHRRVCVEIKRESASALSLSVSGTANKNAQAMKLRIDKFAATLGENKS